MNDNRKMDSTKLIYHMDRVIEHFDKGERVAPIHIDMGLSKFCNINCVFCVTGSTNILMGDFTWKKIKDIKINDIVMGFDENRNLIKGKKNYARYYPTKVTKIFKNRGRTHKISYNNTSLRITNEHPILCNGHRWRSIKKLKDGDKIRFFTEPYKTDFVENCFYKLGYLKGVLEGDGTVCSFVDKRKNKNNYEFRKFKVQMNDLEAIDRIEKYFKDLFKIKLKRTKAKILRTDNKKDVNFIEKALLFRKITKFEDFPSDYSRGYLAGIFDAEGSFSCNILRISQIYHKSVILNIDKVLNLLEFKFVKETKGFRLVGGYGEFSKFFGQCKPVIKRKYKKFYNKSIPKTISVKKYIYGKGGITEDVYNLETEAHTYVANGFCVHNCYGIFQNISREYIKYEPLMKTLRGAKKIGVKSIAFIGDGEPTMNPHLYDALKTGKNVGLDLALSTNGVLLNTDEKLETILDTCTWMRFCICAGDKEGYLKNHRVDKFDVVKENIKRIVELKHKKNSKCDIGMQAVYVPGLMDEDMIKQAVLARELGVDYFVIKQCSLPEDNNSVGDIKFDINAYTNEKVFRVLNMAEALSNQYTKIIPKWNTIKRKGIREYKNCPAVPLISEISGNGDWFPCGYFFGNKPEFEQYKFGNIHEKSLLEIFESDRYWNIINYFRSKFDSQKSCLGACRLDACNKFIHDYINKPKGINFI